MYTIGTLILYDRRGVFEVEGVGAPPPPGEGGVYYKLRSAFSVNNEVIYVPVDTAVFLRPLIREEEVFAYLELASQLEPQIFTSRKSTDLIAHYRGRLASCKLEDCLLLLKEIDQKQKGRKLGQIDQQYQKRAERLVCEEFAAVLHTTPDAMKKRLYAAMRRRKAPKGQPQAAAL